MSAKSNKIELSEDFMAMWRDENEKCRSLKRISDKFQIFSDSIFE